MITTIFSNMIGKLSVKPDKIAVGPGFHKDMESFGQSVGPGVFCVINKTEIVLDPSIQGRRVKVYLDGKPRTFNYKTFIQNVNVDL